ncbi:MAG: M23 family metallopeptidase, partial [Roseiarcus sp.]
SKANLEATQKKLVQVGADRVKATADRERLAAERDGLKKQLREIEGRLAKAAPGDAGAGAAMAALAPQTRSRAGAAFADLESLLASTGLNVEHLLGRAGGTPRGEGGPYIALGDAKNLSAEEQAKRNEILKKLLKSLPLSAPLAQFQVESPFGPRVDPLNKRDGFHPGVDLSAPFLSPVYSTAPGIVSFAGVNGNYGKFVEIDHGNGIVTHYAHLHRLMVVKGQKVGGRQQIGQLGSTGRSTGPHVHYEVVVDGDPLDPEKFMEAGKNVVQVSGK